VFYKNKIGVIGWLQYELRAVVIMLKGVARCSDSGLATGSESRSNEENSGVDGGKLCHIYAQIRESSTPSNVVVCSDEEQQTERLVYTSESHVVHVQLTAATDDNDVYFLIKFEGLQPMRENL